MNKYKLILAVASGLFVGSINAGVMEVLDNDPNTGVVIGARDYQEDPLFDTQVKTTKGVDHASNADSVSKMAKKLPKNTIPQEKVEPKVKPLVTSSATSANAVGHSISSKSVTTPIHQPTQKVKSAQSALATTDYQYLMVTKPSERTFVNDRDGLVYFQMRKGPLKENIFALLFATKAEAPVMSGISDNHHVPANMWINGETVIDVLDAMLYSYDDPYPIWAHPYKNRIVEVKYNVKAN